MPNSSHIAFALNHMVAPKFSAADFMALAHDLGIRQIEIRNDLKGVELETGLSPEQIGEKASALGLEIITINALQRFNDWSDIRAAEATALAAAAKACGAKALIMCPVNDTAWQPSAAEKTKKLETALAALKPILESHGITGLIEPLGFVECSLRSKREAVAAIDKIGGAKTFKLVHDTFHHHVAGEPELFAAHTGLVHISGVEDKSVPVAKMRDPHRVLVNATDLIDNTGQMRALQAAGYSGYFSYEPFTEIGHSAADIKAALKKSMQYVEVALKRASV